MEVKKNNKFKQIMHLLLVVAMLLSAINIYPLSVAANAIESSPLTDNKEEQEQEQANIEDFSLRNQTVNKLGATLKTPIFENVNTNQSYNVEYEVTIPEITPGVEGELYDEVVFLVDLSSEMYGEKWKELKDFFASYFENTLNNKNTKIGIVPFRDNILSPDTSHGNNTNFDQLLTMQEMSNINMIKDAFGKEYLLPNQYNDQRNITAALEKAQTLLEEGFHLNKKQAVILVSSGAYHVWDTNKVDKFAKYEHKIITVDISNGKETDLNQVTKAKDVHYMLGGTEADYIKTYIHDKPTVVEGLIAAMKRVNPISKQSDISQQSANFTHSVASEFDEVIIAVDASSKMYRERWDQVKSFFVNDFKTSPSLPNLKIGLIPYTDKVETPIKKPSNENIDINRLFDGSNSEHVTLIQDIFGNNYVYAIKDNGEREIFDIAQRALSLFESGRADSKKQALILISSGGFENYNDTLINQLKNTGITTITINTDTQQVLATESAHTIHQKLGGLEKNYLTADTNTTPSIRDLLVQIFDGDSSNEGGSGGSGSVSDVKLKFDLGEHLQLSDSSQSNKQIYEVPISAESNSIVKISFDVKLKQLVQSTTFESAVLSYVDGSGTTREIKLDKPIFNTAQIPNITATLKSANPYTTTLNSEIELVYGIKAESFEYTKEHNELKEIVFVIDGTANGGFYNNLISSFATKVFDDFVAKNNIKAGLVVYNRNGVSKKELTDNINSIKDEINKINGTNWSGADITQAVMAADDILNKGTSTNKNIIFVTAGEFNYSESTLNQIKGKYNVFSMEQQNKSNKLEALHLFLTGNKNNYVPYTGNGNEETALGLLLDKLNDQLVDHFQITDATLHFNLDQKFIYQDSEEGRIQVQIPTITYNLIEENGKKIYKAESIGDVSFSINAKDVGEFKFAENKPNVFENYLAYSDLNKQPVKKMMVTPTIIVEETVVNDYDITMKVSDVGASINKTYSYQDNGAYYTVDNAGETYKLYGPSNVEIKFEGTDLTHLRYQFVKQGSTINDNDWKYISGSNDIDTTKSGFLTQMPYDVSHMELLSNNERWSNRNEVFKTEFANETGPISMAVSPAHDHTNCNSTDNHYVIEQQVVNSEGKTVTRYVPKTLFVANHRVSSYAPNYKEASKTWGYFQAPETGDYYFRTYADDGFFGTLAVDDEPFVIGNDFKPRGSSAIDSKTAVHLKAGEFYPIYLEYFNWGGSADYRIMYSIGDKNNFKIIDAKHFFPSKSDAPTDGSNNIFMGNDKVSFVTDPGVYTIYYEAGKLENNQFDSKVQGSYGKFEIENRFELSKELSSDEVDLNEEFLISYTVTPKPIKLIDLYKVSANDLPTSNIPNTLTVLNLELNDQLPTGIVRTDNDLASIYKLLSDVTYTRSGNEYKASAQTFDVKIKATDLDAAFIIQTGDLDYRDVSLVDNLRISQKQQFTEIPSLKVYENSLIIKHGLYNGQSIKDGGFKVVDKMTYQAGFVIDAKGLNNGFNVKIPQELSIQPQAVYLYELDENENIIVESKQKLITDGRIIHFESTKLNPIIQTSKKYAVVYQVNGITKNSTIEAQMLTGSQKNLQLQLETEMPDLL